MNVYLPSTGFATQGPCADGFHIPTSTEFGALKTAGVTLGAWASNGGNNAKTYLKLPFAGDRNYKTASVESANSQGYYWCSDGSGTTVVTGYGYMIFSNYFDLSALQPGIGASIRPFKDTPVVPNSNWATLYAGTGDAGIFHDTTNGLISISADGTNWITIADKNLGATEVYDTGNVSGTNRGNYYQWGNNYAFSYAGTPTTSSTQVNTTGYGPGNYYTSSTFVLNTKGYWFSDLNKNLRGGETGNVNYMSELKNAYIGEYGWKPGSNTLLYIPLDSTNTKNDIYGGNTTTQLGTVRYGTYGGVDCADFTTGGCIYSNMLNGVSTYTVLIWANNINGNSASDGYGGNVFAVLKSGVSHHPGIYYGNSSSSNGYFTFYANNSSGDIYFNTNTKSHWFLFAICISSSTKKAYLFGDGSYKELDISSSTTNSQYAQIGSVLNTNNLTERTDRRFYGYLSNLIIENKARTAEEISHYYDITKANYGL